MWTKILLWAAILAVAAAQLPIVPDCISICTGQPNQQRPNCEDCSKYIVCNFGYRFDMPCPSGLLYDRYLGRCEYVINETCATTTPPTTTPPTTPPTTTPPTTPPTTAPTTAPTAASLVSRPLCVTSCSGLAEGDYQSCSSNCSVYATCANGWLYDNRPCVTGLVWDDLLRRCEYVSTTCPRPTPSRCVSDCTGVAVGDHQSCLGCNVYVSCGPGGNKWDNRPCPDFLVWDDNLKRCEWSSTTCP